MTELLKPSGHATYKDSAGKRLVGVTTILAVMAKPALIKWANNLGLAGIDSTTYVDNLADVGTLAHHMILCKFKNATPDMSDFTENQIKMATASLASFTSWESSHEVKPLVTEEVLISEEFGFGGTPDLLCELDGIVTLLDFKTGKALYPEVLYQLGAYAYLLSGAGWSIDQAVALRIGRELGEGFEVINFTTEALQEGFKVFHLCLQLYRQTYLTKKNYWRK